MLNQRWKQIRILGLMLPLLAMKAGSAESDGDGDGADRGLSSVLPWSGPWWPHRAGGLTGPLHKYDEATGAHSESWERTHHVDTATQDWFGHCHAWAASSVTEREPRAPRRYGGIDFGVGDLKGLLAACHARDIANSYGDRFGDGLGSEDPGDLSPDDLWRLLQLYLGQQQLPLILDLEAGPEVWNHPVFRYEVDIATPPAEGWAQVTLRLAAVDDAVPPDFLGTRPLVHAYTFRVRFEGGAVVAGSGQWTGRSVQDHPDFAWYPYIAAAENPEVNVAEVSKIVGTRIGDEPIASAVPPAPEGAQPGPPRTGPPTSGANEGGAGHETSGGLAEITATTGVAWPLNETLSPHELADAIADRTSHFPLDVIVDRGDGGRYRQGEPVRISVRSGEDGYLYLFDAHEQGELALVYPASGESNTIRAGVLHTLPPGKKATLLAAGRPGLHNLKAIVTPNPLQISGIREAAVDGMQRQPQVDGPQVLLVHPGARRQVEQAIAESFRKGGPAQRPSPRNLGRSSQDACLYFVTHPVAPDGPSK